MRGRFVRSRLSSDSLYTRLLSVPASSGVCCLVVPASWRYCGPRMDSPKFKKKLHSLPVGPATFIEPMDCQAVTKIPDTPAWVYEIKLDGYRAVAIKSEGRLNLVSRRRNSFNTQYPLVLVANS